MPVIGSMSSLLVRRLTLPASWPCGTETAPRRIVESTLAVPTISPWALSPGRPGTLSSMVVRTAGSCQRAGRLLEEWRQHDTPLSPMPWDGDGIELRPRGGTNRLQARLLTEEPV